VRVLFSADGFVIVDKPSGVSVHRGWDPSRSTVMHQLRGALGQWVYPVHRLDRATSGALIVATDRETASALAALFREGAIDKEYVALVRGVIAEAGVVDHAIASEDRTERLEAITEYRPLAVARERYTLVALSPRTGRSHQLRRHMKHLSRPILGDTTYGDGRENRKLRELGLHRLALHARRLALREPGTGASIEVIAPLPADLRAPLETLGFEAAVLDALDR
jgi:tRNA pseudouridine65 synthase